MTNVYTLPDILEALKQVDLIDIIGQGFVSLSKNQVMTPPIGEMLFPDSNGEVHIKYGAIKNDNDFVIKMATGFFNNPQKGLPPFSGCMLVFSQNTGQIKAVLLEEGELTNHRTAAAGAVAANGGMDVQFLVMLLMLAAFAGDNTNYWIGRYLGPKIFSRTDSRILNRKHLDRTNLYVFINSELDNGVEAYTEIGAYHSAAVQQIYPGTTLGAGGCAATGTCTQPYLVPLSNYWLNQLVDSSGRKFVDREVKNGLGVWKARHRFDTPRGYNSHRTTLRLVQGFRGRAS